MVKKSKVLFYVNKIIINYLIDQFTSQTLPPQLPGNRYD